MIRSYACTAHVFPIHVKSVTCSDVGSSARHHCVHAANHWAALQLTSAMTMDSLVYSSRIRFCKIEMKRNMNLYLQRWVEGCLRSFVSESSLLMSIETIQTILLLSLIFISPSKFLFQSLQHQCTPQKRKDDLPLCKHDLYHRVCYIAWHCHNFNRQKACPNDTLT